MITMTCTLVSVDVNCRLVDAFMRENWREIRSIYAENHLAFVEVLQQSRYVRDNNV